MSLAWFKIFMHVMTVLPRDEACLIGERDVKGWQRVVEDEIWALSRTFKEVQDSCGICRFALPFITWPVIGQMCGSISTLTYDMVCSCAGRGKIAFKDAAICQFVDLSSNLGRHAGAKLNYLGLRWEPTAMSPRRP